MGNRLEENKQQYIREYYLPGCSTLPGIEKYTDICGWTDYYLNGNVLFSRRRVFYDLATFPDKLHKHGFYETVEFKPQSAQVHADQVRILRHLGGWVQKQEG